MSKQRPSNRGESSASPPKAANKWLRRVYRNSFTRDGKLQKVQTWSVKIQHQGIRRAFSLGAVSRSEAARRAAAIHDDLEKHGWHETVSRMHKLGEEPSGKNDQSSDAHWNGRLIHRRYMEMLRPKRSEEFFVRMEHEGSYSCFPLGTQNERQAAARAQEIHELLMRKGWQAVNDAFSREFTVAIFWSNNPVACTYTTLLSFADDGIGVTEAASVVASAHKRICLVEPEICVASALNHWLSAQTGFQCDSIIADPATWEQAIVRRKPDLILMNRALAGMASNASVESLRERFPHSPVFPYGIYEDSDQIFIRLTGVTGGYLFHRRPPRALLEPIIGGWEHKPFNERSVRQRLQTYFQSLFGNLPMETENAELSALTVREQEVLSLLSHGHVDKEIAGSLRISVWTVHNHLKRIYEKLKVRSRTEAVVKYLHK